ncbi:amidase domain-containing protein [Streptomyces sp. ML-6]|uniref:amidase domain-containing protein n=1 Tax=Streptomyces sp. ML-6 TaxID=2982693 RepID=UPI0024BFA7D1|nr:amidase domain-containing protein [Streptomyces sp. ML-6]MDK0520696.1 amidase domain-containing protein [Streptomyces sp. ML-6]
MRMHTSHRRILVPALTTALLSVGTVAAADAAARPSTPPDSDRLSRLAERYLQQRADAVTTNPVRLRPADVLSAATGPMRAELQHDLAALARKGNTYKKADGGYTHAEVDVTVLGTTIHGSSATSRIIENGRLRLPFTAAEVADGAPEYEEYSVPHTLTFTRDTSGAWLLAKDRAEVDGGPVPSTQIADPVDAPAPDSENEGDKGTPSATTEPPSGSVDPRIVPAAKASATASYNYSAMVRYANKYWKKPNSNYRTYGNDCTNFISQVMRAGGWKATSGSFASRKNNKKWFYASHTWTTSYTWAGAENWYWFAVKHSKRTKSLDNVWKLVSADVLQANWKPRKDDIIDHTMVVTKLYKGTPYLTYHTGNTHNKSLRKLLADHPNAAWYAHRT